MNEEHKRIAREIKNANEISRNLGTALLLATGIWGFLLVIAAAILASVSSAP